MQRRYYTQIELETREGLMPSLTNSYVHITPVGHEYNLRSKQQKQKNDNVDARKYYSVGRKLANRNLHVLSSERHDLAIVSSNELGLRKTVRRIKIKMLQKIFMREVL